MDDERMQSESRPSSLQPPASSREERVAAFRTLLTERIVIIDGAMLYVIELRGDVESARTKQIYDRVVFSFTAGA